MTEQNNGETVRRLWEDVFNRGDLAAIDDLVSEALTNFRSHERGPEVWRSIATMWRTAFPDLRITVDEEIVHGDAVVHRVTARAPEGWANRQPLGHPQRRADAPADRRAGRAGGSLERAQRQRDRG
jgi:hypothetical protein